MKLYLIRHAQAESNVKRIVNDSLKTKIHITSLGKNQAQFAGKKLANKKIEIIFSSQFPRCQETSKIVNRFLKVKIIKDKRLNEWASGFDGKSYDELNEYLKTDPFILKHKKGESIPKLKKRIISFINDLKNNKKQEYNSVLIVSHEQVLKMLIGYLKNLDDKKAMKIKIPNAKILSFEI